MTRLRALLLCLVLMSSFVEPASARFQSADEVAAAEKAVELSYFEATGDVNALYDGIHPDVHSVVPRAAVIGWYQNEFLPKGPGVAEVTSVRTVEWTWGVTGQVYPYTVEVSFTQFFTDGSVLDDVVRLVQDANGEWRWFFGRTREFVDDQIAKYASIPDVPTSQSGYIDLAIADIDQFWAVSFEAAGLDYRSPDVIAFEYEIETDCGSIASVAAYCFGDETIVFMPSFFADVDYVFGDFAVVNVLAHEWGHHVDNLLDLKFGQGPGSELFADCLAGSYALDAETRGLLDPGDIEEAVYFSNAAGDAPWFPRDQPGSHGSGEDRVQAFAGGYLGGFAGCGLSLADNSVTKSDDAERSSTSDPESEASNGDDLSDLLPRTRDVPAGLDQTGNRDRTLSQVTENYSDPDETEVLFNSLGWDGNVTRTFEGSGNRDDVTYVYVSLHAFGGNGEAADALFHSVDDQEMTTDASRGRVATIGDTTQMLSLETADGYEVTIYTTVDSVMVRVTVLSTSDYPIEVAEDIAASIVERAD